MPGKRKVRFREQQIVAMQGRLRKVDGLKAPLILGGIGILAVAAWLGLSALGVLAFATAMLCMGRGIGYGMESKRLRGSIAAAADRLEEIEMEES